ncbi:YibE/F family protein [Gracilinema caldarium]|uniref:YibE/F family protein n=1 Tax=Gracilinema caldarium (strain ATCC 51460 / DSM 7334 / H1) TaxID=744872 RepID=F8EYT2_GRAC1|nr:YibE/F family protein [Gracilinema caldarium]AEJ18878.1 YibE/F family protein [Gracilinema caldarium DSM 7334]
MTKKALFMGDRKRDIIFALIILMVSILVLFIPTGFTSPYPEGSSHWAKAKILNTDNSTVKTIGPTKHGAQQLELELLSGPFKGRHFSASNLLLGKKELDKFFSPGNLAFVVVDLTEDRTDVAYVNVIDHYRLDATILLFVAFMVVLIGFAGWIGFKALISFICSAALIIKILLPLMLHGWNPVVLTLGIVSLLTFVIIFLVAGFTRKGMVAFAGSMGGVLATTLLSILFTNLFKIHGAVRPFAENLLYMGFDYISLPQLFMAGIFLASSGAVMDLSMDISAALAELVHKHPHISRRDLIRSGFNVGRHVVGTMTTTLLLAYTGGYTALMMTFIAQGVPMANIINMIYVSAELIYTMVGSFGLILVAPITAIVGGYLYTCPIKNKI